MAPTTLILDTNVFYDLGAGKLKIGDIAQPGEVVAYSPVSALELAGKFTSRTFNKRKAAAQAILDHTTLELPDQDTYLTRDVFGWNLLDAPFSFAEGVRAMAQSTSPANVVAGVEDLLARVIRRVSVPKAHGWRLVTEGKWVKDLTKIQRDTIPKFKKWEQDKSRPVPALKGKAKDDFLASTKTLEWATALIVGCQARALDGAKRDATLVPTAASAVTLSSAIDQVACYCAVYTHYLIELLTNKTLPKNNDSGDIELFLYATADDRVVVTSEKKWKRIAEAAGFGQRVRLLPASG